MLSVRCQWHNHINEFIGQEVVGYRYGKAPENGYSYNQMSDCFEPGVSMAQIGYLPEYWSLTTLHYRECKMKRFYYVGKIVGVGGDDECCLSDVRQISYNEYRSLRAQNKDLYRQIAKEFLDDYIGCDIYGIYKDNDVEAYENYERSKYTNRSLPLGFVRGTCPDWWIQKRQRIVANEKATIQAIKKTALIRDYTPYKERKINEKL